jgi:hypothetical protein
VITPIKQPAGNGPREFRCICGHDMATHVIDLAYDDSICAATGCKCERACLWVATFQAPNGLKYVVHDVAKFCRKDFPHLFVRADTEVSKKPSGSDYTIAEDGLRRLAEGFGDSWHEWTVFSKPEKFHK